MAKRIGLEPNISTPASVFTDLLSLAMQFSSQASEQKFRSEESEKERKWEESVIYLRDTLEDKNRSEQHGFELTREARQLGILQEKVDKVPGASKTGGASTITQDKVSRLEDEISDQQEENDLIEEQLSLYYKGFNMGNTLDKDASGVLSEEEIKTYTDKVYKNEDVPRSLKMGLDAWTLDPLKRAELGAQNLATQLAEQQVAREKQLALFLPEQLRQEEIIREQAIAEGILNYDLKEISIDEATLRNKNLKQGLELGAFQLSLAEIEKDKLISTIEREDYEFDAQIRQQTIESTNQLIVNNIESQTGIAAGILSNITIRKQDDSYLPLFDILTNENREEVLKDVNDSRYLTHIKQDVMELVESYRLGKGEDQLPDYSFVLDKLEGLTKLDQFYKSWIISNKQKLDSLAVDNGFIDFQDASLGGSRLDPIADYKISRFAEEEGASVYDRARLMEAIQWSRTGLFSDLKSLEKGILAKEQYRHLHAVLEQALVHDVSYGMEKVAPIYSEKDTSLILDPFSSIPLRTQGDALDIFNDELNK